MMKKSLIALAVLAASGAAMAQSTVTLYGLVDANFGSFKTNSSTATSTAANGTIQNLTQTKIDSGGLNGSRWGLRVSEDLGGGMAAIANLESGFDLSTGAQSTSGNSANALFGRRANVGIAAGFGTLVIGRNSSSYDDVAADHAMMAATIFDPSNTNNGNTAAQAQLVGSALAAGNFATVGSAAATAGFLGRNTTWVGYNTRFNNSVKYTSPNFSGFSGSAMYALGEDKTAATDASKTVSANLKYANGPLLVSGGYQSETEAKSVTSVGKPALENALLSVAYDFGVAKVGAGFNRAKYKAITATGGDLNAQKEWSLSVAVPLGATTLSAGYAQSKGDDLGKSTGFGIQALYALSKRTTLYAGGLSTKAYDNLANAVLNVSPTSTIGRTTTYAAGLRHTF